MYEFESMEEMVVRLRGTSGSAQASAVVTSIKMIDGAAGVLDSTNAQAALYHLAVALVGQDHAAGLIENTAFLLYPEEE